MRLLVALAAASSAAVLVPSPAAAQAPDPVVIVVRGVGAETPALQGWSPNVARRWGIGEVREVRFRYLDGRVPATYPEFAPVASFWARQIQAGLEREVARARREGRPVIVVAHSWGSVATAIALAGGGDRGRPLAPIRLEPGSIDRFVTLGSTLGLAQRGPVYASEGSGLPVHLEIPRGRPAVVRDWTNVVNVHDPLTIRSRDLEGAENVEVREAAAFLATREGVAREEVWVLPEVVETLREVRRVVADSAAAEAAARAAADTALLDTALAETSVVGTPSRRPPSEARPRRPYDEDEAETYLAPAPARTPTTAAPVRSTAPVSGVTRGSSVAPAGSLRPLRPPPDEVDTPGRETAAETPPARRR